jgi:hypothetical protein
MSSFNYFRDIPNGPNDPSDDQPLMRINTNSIDSLIAVDHYSFGSSGNLDGWHKESTYPSFALVPAPGPPTNTTQGAVYTKDVGGGVIQLFYRREGSGVEIQLTELGKLFHVPTIITSDAPNAPFTPIIAYSTIVALPPDVYGYIIFLSGNAPMIGQFSTNATDVRAISNPIFNDLLDINVKPPISLRTQIGSLNLEGRLVVGSGLSTPTPWRIHYWEV